MGLQALGMRVAVSDESHPRPNFRISIPKAVSLCVLSCDLMVMVQVSMKLLDAKQENMLSLVSLFTMVRSCDVFLGRKYFLSLALLSSLLSSSLLFSTLLYSFLSCVPFYSCFIRLLTQPRSLLLRIQQAAFSLKESSLTQLPGWSWSLRCQREQL